MQHTLIDPFELTYTIPPPRAPMATLSIDIDFSEDIIPRSVGSEPDIAPESGVRIRCWCSEELPA
jgi:hypothetical protein